MRYLYIWGVTNVNNFIYFWNEKRIIKKERPEKTTSKLREKNFDYNFALTDEKIIP